jgi:hypothetical protein
MDIAPPALRHGRVEELGDRLVVTLRPRRIWAHCLLLIPWLAATVFVVRYGIRSLRDADAVHALVMVVWLAFWLFCTAGAIVTAVWMLFGRELIEVDANEIAVRDAVGRVGRTKRYPSVLVDDVSAVPVPRIDDEDPPSPYFTLQIVNRGRDVHVGDWLTHEEADALASAVKSFIRPFSR